jgi:hypothetical protein
MSGILDTLLNVGTGGLFGLIGAGVTSFMNFKQQKLANEHEVAMAGQGREDMLLELELSKQQGAIDLELQESDADARNLTAAINAETVLKAASPWVQDIKALTRPFLTYLLVISAIVMVAMESKSIYVNDIIFLAGLSVSFWFGSRGQKVKT